MKRNIIALIFCSMALIGCSATSALTGTQPSTHRYQDGVYNARLFRQENRQSLADSRTNASELITKTQQSGIYTTDTVVIYKNGTAKGKPVVYLDYDINPFDVRFSFAFGFGFNYGWYYRWPYWRIYGPWYWDPWYWDDIYFHRWNWGIHWSWGPWGPWGYGPYGPHYPYDPYWPGWGPHRSWGPWYPGGWEPARPVVKSLNAGRHGAFGTSMRNNGTYRRTNTGLGTYGSSGSSVIRSGDPSQTPRQRTPETPEGARTVHNNSYNGSYNNSANGSYNNSNNGSRYSRPENHTPNKSGGYPSGSNSNVRPSSTSTGTAPASSGSYRSGAGTVTYGSQGGRGETRSSSATRSTNQNLNKSVRSARSNSASSGHSSSRSSSYRRSESSSSSYSGSSYGNSSSYSSSGRSSGGYSGGGHSGGGGYSGGGHSGGGHSGNTGRR